MKTFKQLCEEVLNEGKLSSEVSKIVKDIQKKLGGKIKDKSTKNIMIVLTDPDLYGDYGEDKDDMKVDKIEFETNKSYYPKIDMVYHFNDGLVVDEVIETANDAFEKFKDMS